MDVLLPLSPKQVVHKVTCYVAHNQQMLKKKLAGLSNQWKANPRRNGSPELSEIAPPRSCNLMVGEGGKSVLSSFYALLIV